MPTSIESIKQPLSLRTPGARRSVLQRAVGEGVVMSLLALPIDHRTFPHRGTATPPIVLPPDNGINDCTRAATGAAGRAAASGYSRHHFRERWCRFVSSFVSR